jgi:SAM-dependent methyltransferase
MKKELFNILRCPYCGGKLLFSGGNLLCSDCKRRFSVKDGIPSFTSYRDKFYEGKFTESYSFDKKFNSVILNYFKIIYDMVAVDKSRERFFLKNLSKENLNEKNRLILDIGCGGGWQDLTKFGKVVGVDISLKSLRNASKYYDFVVHSSILKLPFPDGTFDIVFSADVIGHVHFKYKKRLISEIYRVTKRGGRSIHSIECDSNSLFYKWAKKYPDLFKKYFIDMYGHFGLELPTNVFKRFREAGFIPLIEKADPCRGYLRPIESYIVFFDNEYKNKSFFVKYFISLLNISFRVRFFKHVINFILGFFIPLSDLFTCVNSRDSVKIYLVK